MTHLQWTCADVHIAFSTVKEGRLIPLERAQTWAATLGVRASVVAPYQIHSNTVITLDALGNCATELCRDGRPEGDGLVCASEQVALGVWGADCPGLVLIAKDALAVAHCGWCGVASGMVRTLSTALGQTSLQPQNTWHAFIGPGISGPRYEVDEPVLGAYDWDTRGIQPSRPGHAYLDVRQTITRDLQREGIQQIHHCGICTATDPLLHSYRHQGPAYSHLLLAWRTSART